MIDPERAAAGARQEAETLAAQMTAALGEPVAVDGVVTDQPHGCAPLWGLAWGLSVLIVVVAGAAVARLAAVGGSAAQIAARAVLAIGAGLVLLVLLGIIGWALWRVVGPSRMPRGHKGVVYLGVGPTRSAFFADQGARSVGLHGPSRMARTPLAVHPRAVVRAATVTGWVIKRVRRSLADGTVYEVEAQAPERRRIVEPLAHGPEPPSSL